MALARLDRHDIDAAENWKDRLRPLVFACDTVVFALTDESASSPICCWNVEEAARPGKRMIRVTPHDPGNVAPPSRLSEIIHGSLGRRRRREQDSRGQLTVDSLCNRADQSAVLQVREGVRERCDLAVIRFGNVDAEPLMDRHHIV